jgi:hypothetical protein
MQNGKDRNFRRTTLSAALSGIAASAEIVALFFTLGFSASRKSIVALIG